MYAELKVEEGVARVLLEHPPVNAFDRRGWQELAALFAGLGRNTAVRAVLVAAEGKGFCAGVDVKELAREPGLITEVNRGCYDTFAAVHHCPVPVIAAVHGFCLGGGIGIAGSCDFVLASEDASFGLPEIDRGALGAASHAARLFGERTARRMLLTGEPIDAREAQRLGALEAVVPHGELRAAALALAARIAAKSPQAVRLAKASLLGIEPVDLERSYRFEQGFTLELYTSPDSQEARRAFLEKRDASFGKVGGEGG